MEIIRKLTLLLLCTTWISCVKAEIFPGSDNKVALTIVGDKIYDLTMDESNDAVKIILFESDTDIGKITFSQESFDITVNNEDGRFKYIADASFDYEKVPSYAFNTGTYFFSFRLTNLDDEPPSISMETCTMQENHDYTKDNSPCTFTVTDMDQMNMDKMVFTVHDFGDVFGTEFTANPTDKEATGVIVTKQQLDYEKQTSYRFKLEAKDSGSNTGETNAVINVGDEPDMPPTWDLPLIYEQFDEEQAMSFDISAKDGDRGINNNILFSLDISDTYLKDCISLEDPEGKNTNKVLVKPIDRDANDYIVVSFNLKAYEEGDTTSEITQTVQFYINDIDDNIPKIDATISTEDIICGDQTITPDPVADTITICENFNSNLNIAIEIKDIDTAINAQFSVTLESEPDGAFQIIPPTGYRSSTVNIAVTNATKLDFEGAKKGQEDFSHIKLTIITEGINNKASTDSKIINVVLKDYNDEVPKFSDSYEFTALETVKKGTIIGTTLATDLDDGDLVSYAIKGTIQSKLKINDKGEIIVNTDNAFDCDIACSYTFQVTATDTAKHQTTVNVNLELTDVNNKKPDFEVKGNEPVPEDQDKGSHLPLTVTVSSSFEGADLGAKILWDKTTILKNYEVLDRDSTMECFDLTINKVGQSLILTFEINQDHSPDFETFDTMNLMLQMENKNIDPEFEDNRYNEQSININVMDVNDNPPIWTSDTLERNYTIVDGAVPDSSASFIRATDVDLNENLTYSIQSKDDGDRDWIRVDSSTGGLYTNRIIDCDTDKVYFLNYEIEVTDNDQKHSANHEIKIYIIDKNNKVPTADISGTIHVKEHTETSTKFYNIEYKDLDRDDPYNVLTCLISSTTPDNEYCKNSITITEKTAITVANKDLLDREKVEQCDYELDCKDNYELVNGEISNPLPLKFTLILDDINDNAPEMDIKEYKCLENVKQGEEAIKLQATDADIGDNGVVIVSLNTVKDENEKVVNDIFEIEAQDDNIGSLKVLKDLQGLYGKYTLNIDLTDKGDPPLKTNLDVTLTVGKYNFYGPTFIYPEEGQLQVDLALHQIPKQVLTLSDNTELPNFEATYYENKAKCDNKWNIEFNIDTVTGPNAEDLFVISPTSSRYCVARLEVKQETTFENNAEYTIKITARIKTEEGEEEGDAPLDTSTLFKIRFFEVTDPYFEDNSLVTWSVFEDSDDNGTFTRNLKEFNGQLTPATYGSSTPNKIYYYVDENDYFDVESNDDGKTTLSVVQRKKIMYEDYNNITFNIKCSKNPQQWSNDNPKAILPILIDVIDVNNNPPEFVIDGGGDHYIKAITTLYKSDPVLTVKATDKDTVANHLTYSIPEETIQCPDKVSKCPFTINSESGAISTNFELQTTMEGFFTFDVTVKDEVDPNNGKSFETSVHVRIVIIISDNILVFRFDNTAEEIYAQSEFLLESINEVLRYSADIIYVEDDIDEKIAKVSTYFLDGDNALLASDILKKFSDVSVFRELRDKLREQNLELLNFPGTTTDEDQTAALKAWLIGVSVVLGVLCVVLLVLFIWKTRSLKSRIAKLTDTTFGSDESINKRGAVNAPNTNIFAVEGQNPVFNIEKPEKNREIDAHSIASGDSDLIGVENNANFDIFKKEDNADEYI